MSSEPLWRPSSDRIKNSNFQRYFSYLEQHYDLKFDSYNDLYQWSIKEISLFWESLWKFFDLKSSPYTKVMGERKMPGTKWFEGCTFNFAENLLRYRDDQEAIVGIGEKGVTHRISYKELTVRVAKIAKGLRDAGVKKGDRVAAFIPNIPEAVIGMLAANSLGAVWSSCSPDFGINGVLDRFGQIKPKVLVTADGYFYNGKTFSSISRVAEIIKDLPSVEKIVVVPYIEKKPDISALPNAVFATNCIWNTRNFKNFCRHVTRGCPLFNGHPYFLF